MESEDGSWVKIVPRPGSLVVNLGENLSKMTGGRIKATNHRVVDIGQTRYSVPFFFEPAYHARLPQNLPSAEEVQENNITSATDCPDCYIYGEWLLSRITKFVEYQDLGKLAKARPN